MNWFKSSCLFLVLSSLAFAQASAGPDGKSFFLRDGDVYVIYGDSITDNSVYARLIENYVLTRFPEWHVTFYNYGWGGDVARNLFRVQRDVVPIKPTVFTECMGMNDASYSAINPGRLDTYVNAYRQMVPLVRQANPNVRIALISAIPYENRASSGTADGAYAQTLRCFAQAKARVARELGVGFLDLFTGYAEKMGAGKVIYPDFIMSADGVHPNVIGQTVMAQVILKEMHAPSLIALARIEVMGKDTKVTQAVACQVLDLVLSEKGELSFSRLAEALPCPVEAAGEPAGRFLDVTGFNDEINRDMLIVRGLPEKAYELKIDNVSIDVYSGQELAFGVNISRPMKGPLWDQANAVMRATLDRQYAHYGKWRNAWLAHGGRDAGQYDLSDKARIANLDARIEAAIKEQHKVNQTKWHAFTLTPVADPSPVYPAPVTFSGSRTIAAPPALQPLDWTKAKVRAIDLKAVVNRGFADAVADDGQGGWSDQGPANDLSSFPVGKRVLAGVPFEIIDPARNNGKSMLVLSQRVGLKAPASAIIPIGGKARTLAFLHAGAWMPEGAPPVMVTIHYCGGLTCKTQFNVGPQLWDWWAAPKTFAAAVNAWTGKNHSEAVSVLYTPLINAMPDAAVESIELAAPNSAQWVYGLIAVTALE